MYTEQEIKKINKDIETHFKGVLYPITEGMKLTFEGLSQMVFFDRYSFHDKELITLSKNDLVILTVKDHPIFPKRGLGRVQKIHEDGKVTIVVNPEYRTDEIKDGIMVLDKNKIEKPMELYYEQLAQRVGGVTGLASIEKEEIREKIAEQFVNVLKETLLVPAGRVLNSAGTGKQTTYFNCYVMPFIKDSREGISHHREQVMEIMSRGGGVGTNGSTLRPRNTLAKGVNGKSSGAVSWLHDIAELTHLVSQGGQRRGAQMILLADWHVDIVEFVLSKMQKPEILRHIIRTTKDASIKEAASNKLKFTPLTPMEQSLYEAGLNSDNPDVVQKSKKVLEDGGIYSVNNPNFLTGANISVAITKEFMDAVEHNKPYPLRFPDVENYTKEEKAYYDEHWAECGDVREWEKTGLAVKTHRYIEAQELWHLINICATYSAEPGVFFIDNANKMTNATAYGQKVVATNPCGEQPLAPWSICNLSAINLAKFADFKGGFNEKLLKETVRVAVRLQDNIIDTSPYFLEANRKQALGERRVGLGVMGLADFLIKLQVRYGSKEGIEWTDRVFRIIKETAYEESISIAKEKGSFPFLIGKTNKETMQLREAFINTGFMKTMPSYIREAVLKYGIRHSHLITVAPTGSTGTLIGGSTGLEPYFSFKYYRSGRLGQAIEVNAAIVEEYFNAFPEKRAEGLPDFFVAAMDLTPEEHVDTQCTIQKHVDSALSKTVNAPKGYSIENVKKIYERLYKGGAKGGTVYVDGSRDSQVLTLEDPTQTNEDTEINLDEIDTPKENVQKETSGKKLGSDIGDTCFVCEQGTLIDSGGCVTCSNCGVQTKCGL